MAYVLVRTADDADWRAYHDIRRLVLWEERGLSGYDATRPEERLPDHHPLLLKFNAQACGTTRLDDLRDGTALSGSLPSPLTFVDRDMVALLTQG